LRLELPWVLDESDAKRWHFVFKNYITTNMIEAGDNHTIRLLQEMRTEAAARDEKTQAQIGTLAENMLRQTKRIDSLADIVSALRDDIRALA
jgi:hypothetical protein